MHLALWVTAEWLEDGEEGCSWDMRREAFFHTVSGKGQVAKGIIVVRKGADPNVGLKMSVEGRERPALGRRGVKP